VHLRPVDRAQGDELFLLWTYHTAAANFEWPPVFDPDYAEVCLRGASAMVPGLARYAGQGRHAVTDGGYYCKTAENRPLIGPLPIEGAYVIGALSGYGIMAAQAAAELVSAHLTGGDLPAYAQALLPSRYDDPAYQDFVALSGAAAGQL
jgi:glycine/D-amino acid oxidase-like deaminating enzyme